MQTFLQWAKANDKNIFLDEKQLRTVSSFPGSVAYPPQTGAPNGDDSVYPPQVNAMASPTGALSVEIGKKKKKK